MPTPPPPDDHRGLVLLIIDMMSTWDFEDAELLLPHAQAVAPRIAALKARFVAAGLPVVYANDNQGRWRSDFRELAQAASAEGAPGAGIVRLLAPSEDDYFVLKPKHSAFFCTPMELLLQDLQITRLVLTGVTSDQCVTTTAAAARMRNYDVHVPRDCVASQSVARNARALEHFDQVMKVDTRPASEMTLPEPD